MICISNSKRKKAKAFKDSIEFEKLIAAIYQSINEAEGFDTVHIEHKKKVLLKSGATAEFDIYWEFEQAGVLHKVAIECKHWNSRVNVGKVQEFVNKLDGAGNVRGVMVTCKGYQQGAKKEAFFYGIKLVKYELSNFDQLGLPSLHNAYNLDTLIYSPTIELAQPDSPGLHKRIADGIRQNNIFIESTTGERISELKEFIKTTLHVTVFEKNIEQWSRFVFTKPHLIALGNNEKLAIKSIKVFFRITDITITIVKINDFLKGILVDEESGKIFLYHMSSADTGLSCFKYPC